jgi:hypothetical protein
MGDYECRKSEIGLRLTATRWKKQKVCNLAICMFSIGEARDVEQDECELERSPFRCRLCGWIASRARVTAPRGRGYCEVHKPECVSRDHVTGQNIDAVNETLTRRLHVSDEPFRRLAPPYS